LRQHGCFGCAARADGPAEGDALAAPTAPLLVEPGADAGWLEDELVALTGAAAALGTRAQFWAWRASAGFADCDRATVEPVVAAVRGACSRMLGSRQPKD
jgi:hypothetical protein